MKWFLKCLKQYADFKGRARRREYWFFQLFYYIFFTLLMLVVALQEQIIDVEILVYLFPLYVLAMIIPSLSVSIRRLHDTGHSGWWYFIIIIPLIGPVWLFVLLVTDSKPEENKWGPNPKSN